MIRESYHRTRNKGIFFFKLRSLHIISYCHNQCLLSKGVIQHTAIRGLFSVLIEGEPFLSTGTVDSRCPSVANTPALCFKRA